jgi:hypothetical protein
MLQRLAHSADEAHKQHRLTGERLDEFDRLVRIIDAPARSSKHELPLYFSSKVTTPAEDRAALRRLIVSHRLLVDEIDHASVELREITKLPVSQIASAISQGEWLFEIFLSYAHDDGALAQELLATIEEPIHRRGFSLWTDRDLELGDAWEKAIRKRLETVDAAILLVSPTFLKARFIRNELLPTLRRRQAEGMKICPILTKRVDGSGVGSLQLTDFLPREGSLDRDYPSPEDRQAFYQEALLPELGLALEQLCDPKVAKSQHSYF